MSGNPGAQPGLSGVPAPAVPGQRIGRIDPPGAPAPGAPTGVAGPAAIPGPRGPGPAPGMRLYLPIPRMGWYELPLDPADRTAAIAARWTELKATEPALDRPEIAAAFADTLRTLASHYARRGSQVAAIGWAAASGRPPDSVLDVKLVEPLPAESARDEAEGLTGLLMLPSPDDASPRTVQLVDLPAGPAARLRLLGPGGRDTTGRDVVCDIVQYWLPAPAVGATVLVSCSTSDLAGGDRVAAVVDTLVTGLTVEPRAGLSAG
jgi:hypothetical protein